MDHARPPSKTRLIKRTALIAAVACTLVCGGVTLARIDFSTQRVDRGRITIDTVQHGTMEVKISASGQLLPKNIEQIASQVTGRVARKYVKPGDVVKVGEPLLELTNPQLVASAEEARSAWEGAVTQLRASESELQTNALNQEITLTQAQFSLQKAQVQLEAETKLSGQHIIPEIDFKRSQLNVALLGRTCEIEASRLRRIRDNIKVQLAVGQARVSELARVLDRARSQVANLTVVAGIEGIVQAMGVEVGQELQPGAPIGRVAQPDRLYAELKVPAREAVEVQTGQSALIDTRAGTVNGIVTRVDPAVTDGTVVVDVDVEGPLPAGARPQLAIEGTLYLTRLPDTLYVGKPAYVKTNSVITVYKLDATGRYASRVPITAGKLSVNYLQVLRGLHAGDRIITSDSGEWQDKDRILID